jgi:predicted amidohydrolase
MTAYPERIRAAVVQMDIALGVVDKNLAAAREILEVLDCDLAVLPEMWTCGFDNRFLVGHAQRTPGVLEELASICGSRKMVVAGSMPERSGDAIYNTLYVIDSDGRLAGSYRKTHLFRPTEEHRYYCPGDAIGVCETSVGKLGMMICYDLRFPELCRKIALEGAGLVVVSAQWPVSRIGHWKVLTEARAIENQLYLVCANRCGNDPELVYGGSSRIVSPTGELLADAGESECGQVSADIDPERVTESRSRFSTLKERRTDLYG